MHYSAEVFVALDNGIPLQALEEDAPREEPVDSQARQGKVYVRMPQGGNNLTSFVALAKGSESTC